MEICNQTLVSSEPQIYETVVESIPQNDDVIHSSEEYASGEVEVEVEVDENAAEKSIACPSSSHTIIVQRTVGS